MSNSAKKSTVSSYIVKGTPLIYVLIAVLSVWGYYQIYGHRLILDEKSHYPQIEMFSRGEWHLYVRPGSKYPENALFPAYHFSAYLFSSLCGLSSPEGARLFGVAVSLLLLFTAYKLLRCFYSHEVSLVRAMQVYLLPVLFPFYFLIYTDALAALTMLAALYFTEKKKLFLAGLAGLCCVLVRFNAVVFIPFLILYSYYRIYGLQFSKKTILRFAASVWLHIFTIAAFLVFLIINGRISLAAPSSHPAVLSVGNILFSVVCCGFLFLPENIIRRKEIISWSKKHNILTWMIVIASLYTYIYTPTHKWNQFFWLIRNEILNWLVYDIYTRTIFFAITALSLLAIFSRELQNKGIYMIYLFWALMLLPALLVEPRYYIIPFVLFAVYRKPLGVKSEFAVMIFLMILSIWIHYIHTHSILVL